MIIQFRYVVYFVKVLILSSRSVEAAFFPIWKVFFQIADFFQCLLYFLLGSWKSNQVQKLPFSAVVSAVTADCSVNGWRLFSLKDFKMTVCCLYRLVSARIPPNLSLARIILYGFWWFSRLAFCPRLWWLATNFLFWSLLQPENWWSLYTPFVKAEKLARLRENNVV